MKYHKDLMNAILYDRIDIAKCVNVKMIGLDEVCACLVVFVPALVCQCSCVVSFMYGAVVLGRWVPLCPAAFAYTHDVDSAIYA